MLYSLLHLFGYGNLKIDDLKQFRQLESLTPGHPEYGHTVGVEATTGPLGAGLGMAVGMAVAEKHLAAKYNRKGREVINHYTYVLCGDGCLMEGISSEVMSFAGTNELGKLIVLYDDNSITIEGDTGITFQENVMKRFEAFGFQTICVEDGNDTRAIGKAIEASKAEKQRPSFIKISTKIGYGSVKEGMASAHGEPLGVENVKKLREKLEWPLEEAFSIPREVYDYYSGYAEEGRKKEEEWNQLFENYSKRYPELRSELDKDYCQWDIENLLDNEAFWDVRKQEGATRDISGRIVNEIKNILPNFMGGSADLGPSNKTVMNGELYFSASDPGGRNIHYGIRELGMTAIANGILLHRGIRTYIATFFVFADYMKPMLRLASLSGIPQISVLTHDSIGVGEDGPTHQPVEQLTMLRSMPNMFVFRPADEIETRAAWYSALNSRFTPSCLILSRQKLPVLNNSSKMALKGGYIIKKEMNANIDMIFIATGSEVGLAIDTAKMLESEQISTRVVSMPCVELFEQQSLSYKQFVLPETVENRVVIEAGSSISWGRLVGIKGCYITMDTFGASAPAILLFEKYGFTVEKILKRVKQHFAKSIFLKRENVI